MQQNKVVNLFPSSATGQFSEEPISPQSRYVTIKKMARLYEDVVSEASLRNMVWMAEAYAKHPKSGLKSNGFLPVIVRPPNQRKVLLDRVEFEKWLTSRQSVGERD